MCVGWVVCRGSVYVGPDGQGRMSVSRMVEEALLMSCEQQRKWHIMLAEVDSRMASVHRRFNYKGANVYSMRAKWVD